MKFSHSKVICAALVTIAYIALSVFSLYMIAGHVSHDGIPVSDCPYMVGGHSMCSMDFSSHITAWQNMVRALLPSIVLLSIIAFVCGVWRSNTENGPPVFLRRQSIRRFSPYAELFSKGILNPKIP